MKKSQGGIGCVDRKGGGGGCLLRGAREAGGDNKIKNK